jgi:hypothetical protein
MALGLEWFLLLLLLISSNISSNSSEDMVFKPFVDGFMCGNLGSTKVHC